jgi:hypothetical protein
MSIYKQALRQHIRFAYKGCRSVEELWDLAVEELDLIFQGLNAQRKAQSEESLLSAQNKATDELDLQIKIVKDIVETKLEEKALRLDEANKAAQKQKLLEAIARKQDSAMEGMSLEELQKAFEDL